MQRDVKRSVETANLEYYATLQLGVVQMDVWIIGYLRIVQVLTVNPIDEYVMQYGKYWFECLLCFILQHRLAVLY